MNNKTTEQKELNLKEIHEIASNATGNVSPLEVNPDLSFTEGEIVIESKNNSWWTVNKDGKYQKTIIEMNNKQNVLDWAKEKGILNKANPMSQGIKTLEEVQELLKAINCNDEAEIKDAYGDILVTIIIGAKLSGMDIEDCLQSAYDVIKGRTGKMINGEFIKDK